MNGFNGSFTVGFGPYWVLMQMKPIAPAIHKHPVPIDVNGIWHDSNTWLDSDVWKEG